MYFAFILPNLAGGGAEKAILKTAAALLERDHQVALFLLERRASYAQDPRITVHVLAEKLHRGWLGKRWSAWRLRRALRRQMPDLLVSTLPFADEVAALSGVPNHWCRVANTLSAEVGKLRAASPDKAARRLQRYRSLYGGRPLIAVSGGVADDLRENLGLPSQVVTIPNPFDLAAIRRQAAEPSPNLPTRDYVLHVGRFSPQKRHDLLLDAWLAMPQDLDLVLLTAAEPALQAMIEARGLSARVHVAGFQANPYPWMAGARLLVLCSDHEGLPNVLIESLICGTPVISTDCPSGPREILGTALLSALVPCGDAVSLAQRMQAFLASPPSLAALDLSAYSAERTAEAYEAIARANGSTG